MKIYHNPRCRKSRETLAILEGKGVNPDIVLYLETPPGREELKNILKMLGIKASGLVRKGEKIYKENFKGKSLSEEEWVDVLVENPKLIERPIVVEGKKAVIGRPPEKVLELL
ncbi:MAG: arsenate reductase (glutaredoxin) [Phaeodactylibacter sp.]|nr:arsenate reductase (glutaredoxin) [Phaeodactylibacter sp.]MCB9265278.1 arsenate reductase (glutaredoxin) [Lewinellaceae bacterium]MCB9287057.1 arsenate reductase (glutaredoxin) [Lewinellaceae bacterium]